MTLLEALESNHLVLITFVDVERDVQWSVTFEKVSNFARFLSPIASELEYVGEPTDERPFDYFKAIFVTDKPPIFDDNEDDIDGWEQPWKIEA